MCVQIDFITFLYRKVLLIFVNMYILVVQIISISNLR